MVWMASVALQLLLVCPEEESAVPDRPGVGDAVSLQQLPGVSLYGLVCVCVVYRCGSSEAGSVVQCDLSAREMP